MKPSFKEKFAIDYRFRFTDIAKCNSTALRISRITKHFRTNWEAEPGESAVSCFFSQFTPLESNL